MSFESLILDRRDGVATITLNRPDAYNALNLTLGREIFHAALEVDEDPSVRCVVITGAGKAFCAGGDVKDFADNLPRLIGLRRAMELYFTNRVLSAREALEWGLVTRVVPDAELASAVQALARELAHGPSLAFGGAKRLFHHSTWESLETQMELEVRAIAASGRTEDFKSGVTAFANKKQPTFQGR